VAAFCDLLVAKSIVRAEELATRTDEFKTGVRHQGY
jgi:hypothetical protein